MNFTDVQFENKEKQLFEKGLKFAVLSDKNQVAHDNLVIDESIHLIGSLSCLKECADVTRNNQIEVINPTKNNESNSFVILTCSDNHKKIM